jgi:curved DNA-binding protein CbpA
MSEAKDNQNQPKASFRSYYEILGISRTATSEEIQRGFRASALATHPDHHREDPDATRKFQIVNEANQVLSDPLKRLAYDRRLPDLEEDWRRERQADLERQRREEAERRAQQKEQERKEKARMAEEQRKAETARAKAERDKIKDEERIAEEKKIRTQGRELGERLSYWFNTEDGRTQRVKDVDLLVRAQRKALGDR